ncbi:MAG: ferritin-like domain-containing protein, partial [Bryobacteraceae bacterium]
FYTVATTGKTIEQIGIGVCGTGTPGKTTGGEKVHFNGDGDHDEDDEHVGRLRRIAKEIAFDEQQHVLLLRSALGKDAIAKPAINLDALGFGFENFRQFLKLARAFEDVGVSAYGGAAPLIMSKDILATAARIALTEALHAGNLRLLVAENRVHTKPPLDALDILPPPSGRQYFGVDQHGLSTVRTTSQVLAIVFGSSTPSTASGGFFPNGVNGVINMV